jgi:hypothetical protein
MAASMRSEAIGGGAAARPDRDRAGAGDRSRTHPPELGPSYPDSQRRPITQDGGQPGEDPLHRGEEHGMPLGIHSALLQPRRELDQELNELPARRARHAGFCWGRLRHETRSRVGASESTGREQEASPLWLPSNKLNHKMLACLGRAALSAANAQVAAQCRVLQFGGKELRFGCFDRRARKWAPNPTSPSHPCRCRCPIPGRRRRRRGGTPCSPGRHPNPTC